MGNEQPKKSYQPRLQKQQLEISCIKVVGHLELQRDRRMNQGMQKEKVLINMINAPQRSKVDELHKASSIVSDMNYINGCNIVIRYCNIIKDRSLLICESVGKPDNIKELLPFIESVIWAAKHLNLNALQEFQNIMLNFFGAQGIDVTSSPQIDQELRKDFETVMPTPEDINAYIVKLAEKTGIPLEQINSAGHEFYNPQDRQQQQQQQQPNNNNQGPNVGGYFPPPNNQQGGGFGGQGQVYNINVQLPNNQQYPQQYQQNQQQFNQPPQPQQNWNQPPQNNSFNPSNNTSQTSNQQQQNQFSQQQQQPNQFNYQQQQQQQQQNQANYPGFNSNNNIQNPNNNNNNFSNQQQQQQQQQPSINSNNSNNNNSGLPQPQQQQFFQNNQFPSGQSSYPQKQPQDNINNNQFNQPPQQQQNQNQFNQPPQQQQQGNDEDGLDSLEARLKRIREGV